MKTLFTTLLLSFLALGTFAQATGNVVIFSQDGERFWVILNGLRQNQEAATNVRITDLNMPNYKMKIIFEDQSQGEIDKNLLVKLGAETTYNIKKKKVGEQSKNFKKAANAFSKDVFNANDGNKPYDDPNQEELYVFRWVSEAPLAQAPPPPPTQEVVVYHATPPPPAQTMTVTEQTTTTTTVTTNGAPASESVNVGVSMGMDGANFNMSASGSSTGYTEHTTTTVTTTGTGVTGYPADQPPPPAYTLPGYGGPVGCPMPMSDLDFNNASRSISSKTFEDSKLQIAKQIAGSNCLLSRQVRDVMRLFDFEDTRLEFAKYAYGRTYDIGNYYQVNDAFEFELSIDELNAYIGQ